MNGKKIALVVIAVIALASVAHAAPPVETNDFYKGYNVNEIPRESYQSWPYYNYASMHMSEFVAFGVFTLTAKNPSKVKVANTFKISDELRADLLNTQVKGFMVMKDNVVLAEFYDNGYNKGQLNNLQSASKSYAGVILSHAVDQGLIDLTTQAKTYLPELEGSIIGDATIGAISRMNSGLEPLSDYHTPGSNGYEWEKEIGLQPAGEPIGHLKAIIAAKATQSERGTNWDYTDQNTDALGLILAKVYNTPFEQLLSDLHKKFGGVSTIEIAKTSDGTTSPSYGINTTLTDFTLFAQYIAQGKAGDSFYKELTDTSDDVLRKTPGAGDAFSLSGDMTYDMQSYTIADKNIILSHGSFGQTTFSDTETGVSIAFLSDWEDNTVVDKLQKQITNAVKIIEELRK